jgi:hypothetical protein
VAFGIAGLAFTANITLKARPSSRCCCIRARRRTRPPPPDIAPHLLRPPVVSLLVPMFREPEIAERLVTHLRACATRRSGSISCCCWRRMTRSPPARIAAADLPPNMRV